MKARRSSCFANNTGVFTSNYSESNGDVSPGNFFFCNNSLYTVAETLKDDEAFIEGAVEYIDENGEPAVCKEFKSVSSITDGSSWGKDGQETWIVLDASRSLLKRTTIKGDVKLILTDGKKLLAYEGFEVKGKTNTASASSFTIYGQEGNSGLVECKLME